MAETSAPPLEAATAPPAPVVPAEDFRRVEFNIPGGVMAGIAFGDATRPIDIVFLHATGLNARAYRTLLSPLGDRFHVVALDARGHGRTRLPAKPLFYASWRRHRDDLIAFLERHCTQPVTLAGHSMGATVSLLVGGKRPDLVGGLVLVDPVVLSDTFYFFAELPGVPLITRALWPIARKAAARRAHFASREAAIAAFTGRGFFKTFAPEALADYVADGFVDARKGGVRLACAPFYESATFAAQRHHPWAALKRAPDPIVVLRAERRSTISKAEANRFAALRPEARIATVEDSSHALPFERPDRVRAAIESATLMGEHARNVHGSVDFD